MNDDGWLLPRLGDVASVEVAVAAVRKVLDASRASTAPCTAVDLARGPRVTRADPDAALLRVIGAQANLSALLVQLVELQSAAAGESITADWLLDRLCDDQRTHADLAALDDGLPFDA